MTFLHGSWDYNTPLPIERDFFDALEAEDKQFVEFEHSAHSPIMEEPEQCNAVVSERAGRVDATTVTYKDDPAG